MTTYFKATNTSNPKDFFLVALVNEDDIYTSQKGLSTPYRMDLYHACMDLAADPDAKPVTWAWSRILTKLDADAETAALYLQLEESNTRAAEAWKLFQMNTTATELLAACGSESLVMDAIRKQLNFLADPTTRA